MTTFQQVTNAWVTAPPLDDSYDVYLDFRGTGGTTAGGEPLRLSADAFAVVSTMLSLQKPVYYSKALNALSTDALFGAITNDHPGEDSLVKDVELFWSIEEQRGALFLELATRSFVRFDVGSAGDLIAWALSVYTVEVIFDGSTLVMKQDLGS